ncbi:MAG: hypothetical protein D6714_00735 [Bacteroidetes bacterium]|nr:MAG: hypothetical protein D6714_00735 [Bacteroidota bacterium]
MNPVLKNVLAVVVGVIVGGVVNMGLVILGGSVIPLPDGINPADMEALKAAIPNFGFKHFIFPFLGHAVGTLAGAYAAARLAGVRPLWLALSIGFFFLIGGVKMAMDLPAPMAFEVFDVLLAYIPMGWLGWKLSGREG